MRYWQVTTRRFSTHAQKLEQDGAWHPFASVERSWYRVWKKKMIQRVTFETLEEERALLPRFDHLPPIEGLSQTAGFREEIDIRAMEEGLALIVMLGYETESDDALAKQLKREGILLIKQETLLLMGILLTQIDMPSLKAAQEKAEAAKLFYQALRAQGARGLDAAVAAFHQTLKNLEVGRGVEDRG